MKKYSKEFLHLFLAIAALYSQCLFAQPPATGLLLVTEPPATYVEGVEYVSIQKGSMYSTLTLPDGSTRQYYNSGFLVRVDYPRANLSTEISKSDADSNINLIREAMAKYPQHKAKLGIALNKWTNALELQKQVAKKTPSIDNDPPKVPILEIEGAKYENVILTSVDAQSAGISHESGVAKILLEKITKAQAIALNKTSTSAQIDPDWAIKKAAAEKKKAEELAAKAIEVKQHAEKTSESNLTEQGEINAQTKIPVSATALAPEGMVLIPAGSFMMGDSFDDSGDKMTSPVLTRVSAFYMDANLVSLSQWQSVYDWATSHSYRFENLGSGKAANHPVQTVDWYDCVKWCNARSERAGKTPVYYTDAKFKTVYRTGEVTVYANWAVQGYRLPTEAEWEKAARGGLSGQRFPWGNTISESQANYCSKRDMYIYDLGPNGNNSIGRVGGAPCTSPVGSFAPNGYGLYDMAGNVEEWCWDWWVPLTGGTDPHGDGNGNSTIRVTRGGDWSGLAGLACCACRCPQLFGSTVVSETTGFRAVCPKKTTTEGEAVEIKEETGKVNQEPLQFKRKISEQSISQENNDSSVQEKRNTLTLTRFMQMHGIKNANDSAQMMQLAQYLTGFRGSTQFQSMMDALEKMVQTGKVYGMSAQETFKLQESSIKMGSGRSFQEYRMLSPQ